MRHSPRSPVQLVFDPERGQSLRIRLPRDLEPLLALEGAQRRGGLEAHDPVDGARFVAEASQRLLRELHLLPVRGRGIHGLPIAGRQRLRAVHWPLGLDGHSDQGNRGCGSQPGGTQEVPAKHGCQWSLLVVRHAPTSNTMPPASARPPRTRGSGIVFCLSTLALMGPRSTTVSRLVYEMPWYPRDTRPTAMSTIPMMMSGNFMEWLLSTVLLLS